VRHPFSLAALLADPRRGNMVIVGGGMFVFGLLAGAMVSPALAPPMSAPAEPALAVDHDNASVPSAIPLAHRLDPSLAYPVEVLRVIDGDTFQARVRVWPGLDVDTKVRLRGVDAAELHARCAGELAKAQAARAALETILAQGGAAVSRVRLDKYGGRVDANVSTRATADVSAALLDGGFARSYDGGRRGGWCG